MTWQLEPHVSVAETEDGMVLLDEKSGRYYQLNNTGVEVLRVLQDGGTAQAAITSLRVRNPMAADRIERDVTSLMAALVDAGLVRE